MLNSSAAPACCLTKQSTGIQSQRRSSRPLTLGNRICFALSLPQIPLTPATVTSRPRPNERQAVTPQICHSPAKPSRGRGSLRKNSASLKSEPVYRKQRFSPCCTVEPPLPEFSLVWLKISILKSFFRSFSR